jgi:RNA-directed DNA polymerase
MVKVEWDDTWYSVTRGPKWARNGWARVIGWLRRKHRRGTWKERRRRYRRGGWWPSTPQRQLLNPAKVRTTRYRYRGTVIPPPWPVTG